MQKGKFNIVTDGQYGSCGKGLITSAISSRFRPDILSTTNLPNAGHTAVNTNGQKFVAKALPSAAILTKWVDGYKPHIVVGAGAAFDLQQMLHEIEICDTHDRLHIHPRAGVVTEVHRLAESDDGDSSTKHLASTMQGCGAFLADKILRKKNLKLARDYIELNDYMPRHLSKKIGIINDLEDQPLHMQLYKLMVNHKYTILHEGAQGFSLDINHGQGYPSCTSRGTTATQNLADMGIGHCLLGDIYLVLRPYPIRVGNVYEDGKQVGYSGDCYPDQREITWDDVAKASNAPSDISKGEYTTVTHRLRRVYTYSKQQLTEAVAVNGATKLALNFANYIDWSCYGCSDYNALPPKVIDFIKTIEDHAQIPVTIVGTGPQINHVCFL